LFIYTVLKTLYLNGKIRCSCCRLTGCENAPLLLYNYSNAEVVLTKRGFRKRVPRNECELDEHGSVSEANNCTVASVLEIIENTYNGVHKDIAKYVGKNSIL